MVWLLPDPVRTAQTETTGLVDLTWVHLRAHQAEIRPGGVHDGSLVHHIFMRHIAVGEDDLVHLVLVDQVDQFALGVDRDAFWVQLASQFGRVGAAFDIGDLGGGESDHLVIRVVAEEDVEIVEVASGGAHDQGTDR